jgi:NADH-quinone oxidoreductase subunit J
MNNLIILISFLLFLNALIVILVKNPIHSILFLILVFVYSSCLLILLQSDFLAMIFLIIYIGAISVLFLFIIMMLNIRMIELGENENKLKYIPASFIISIFILIQMLFLFYDSNSIDFFNYYDLIKFNYNIDYSFLQILSFLIYTYYKEYFLISGLILFIAMIGVIVLTLNINVIYKKQNLFLQINRDFRNSIKIYKN